MLFRSLPSYWIPATPAAGLLIAWAALDPWLLRGRAGGWWRASVLALLALFTAGLAASARWIPLINDPELPTLPAELLASGDVLRAAACFGLALLLALLLGWGPARWRPFWLLGPQLAVVLFVLTAHLPMVRLGDRVREKDGLSYGVGSGLQVPAVDDRSLFYVYAICNPGNMPKVEKAIREEVDLMLKDGITAEELDAAKQGFLQGEQVARTEDAQLAAIIEESLDAGRSLKYQADLEARVMKVTADDVVKACRKYLDPKKLVIVEAGDFKKSGE